MPRTIQLIRWGWLCCLVGCGPFEIPLWPWGPDPVDTGSPNVAGPGAAGGDPVNAAFDLCPTVADPPTAHAVGTMTRLAFLDRMIAMFAKVEAELEPQRHIPCEAGDACLPVRYTNANGVDVSFRQTSPLPPNDEVQTHVTAAWPTGPLRTLSVARISRAETFESWSFDWEGRHSPFGVDRTVAYEVLDDAFRYRSETCQWSKGDTIRPELGEVAWVWAGGDDQLFVDADDVGYLRDLSRTEVPPWCIGQLDPQTWEIIGDCPE
ncbi:MAG: hypothetical protein AAGA48_03355 [Myxococcota bacterium]